MNGRGMGADPMRTWISLVHLESGAKVRRESDSCKKFSKKSDFQNVGQN